MLIWHGCTLECIASSVARIRGKNAGSSGLLDGMLVSCPAGLNPALSTISQPTGHLISQRLVSGGRLYNGLYVRWAFFILEEAWLMPSGALVWHDMSKVTTWSSDFIRVPSEDKEILI